VQRLEHVSHIRSPLELSNHATPDTYARPSLSRSVALHVQLIITLCKASCNHSLQIRGALPSDCQSIEEKYAFQMPKSAIMSY
jgi:hypothetical protein